MCARSVGWSQETPLSMNGELGTLWLECPISDITAAASMGSMVLAIDVFWPRSLLRTNFALVQ